MLDPFAQLSQHCWGHARTFHMVYKNYGLYSSHDALQVPTCICLHTSANTDETTPNIVCQLMLGVVFDCFDCRLFKFSCVHCRYLFRPYSKHVCSGVNVIWALFVVIGISSAYFHATLSLVGQLLDELAILWGVMLAFALWTPKWMLTLGPIVVDRYGPKYKLKCCCLSSCLFNFSPQFRLPRHTSL